MCTAHHTSGREEEDHPGQRKGIPNTAGAWRLYAWERGYNPKGRSKRKGGRDKQVTDFKPPCCTKMSIFILELRGKDDSERFEDEESMNWDRKAAENKLPTY